MSAKEWIYLALGIWTVLVLTGFGMKAFDWFTSWTCGRKRKPF